MDEKECVGRREVDLVTKTIKENKIKIKDNTENSVSG
jgi:hypothetical protein